MSNNKNINTTVLKKVNAAKYLGVHIDYLLKRNDHINYANNIVRNFFV